MTHQMKACCLPVLLISSSESLKNVKGVRDVTELDFTPKITVFRLQPIAVSGGFGYSLLQIEDFDQLDVMY